MLLETIRSADILNFSLAVGFLLLVGFLCYILFYIGQILKDVKYILDDIENLTYEAKEYTKHIRTGITGILELLFSKREVKKHGRKKR